MKKTLVLFLVIMTASLFIVGQSFADKCKEPIVDEVSAFSESNLESISSEMNKLIVRGADVRVQILSSFHNMKSIDEYKEMFQDKCRDWQAPDGGMKNNLILLLVVPKKRITGYYFGTEWNRFLGANKSAVISDMNSRFRDGKLANGIIAGLRDINNLMSVDPTITKKPVVINNNAATDLSGVSHILGWLLFVLVISGCLWIFMRYRVRRAQSRTAQNNAKTERAKCTTAINGYTTPLALLKAKISKADFNQDWKDYLNAKRIAIESAFSVALTSFNSLIKSANDPEELGLTSEEYEAIARRYELVAKKFESAQVLLRELEIEYEQAVNGRDFPHSGKLRTTEFTQQQNEKPVTHPINTRLGQKHSSVKTAQNGQATSQDLSPIRRSHRDDNQIIEGDTTIIMMDGIGHQHERDFDQPDWQDQRSRHEGPVIIEPQEPELNHSQGDGISNDWGESGQGDGISSDWGKSGQGDGISASFTQESDDNDNSSPDREESSTWTGSGTSY